MVPKQGMAWRLGLALYALLIAAGSLGPAGAEDVGVSDKLAHFIAYAALAVLAWQAFPTRWGLACAGAFAWGVAMELLQAVVPGRFCSGLDLLANAGGVLLGVALMLLWRRLRPLLSAVH